MFGVELCARDGVEVEAETGLVGYAFFCGVASMFRGVHAVTALGAATSTKFEIEAGRGRER